MASDGAVAAAHYGKHAYVQWSVDEGSGDGRGSLMETSRCRLRLRHLRFVVAAAERESFRHAAAELGVNTNSSLRGREVRRWRNRTERSTGTECELAYAFANR